MKYISSAQFQEPIAFCNISFTFISPFDSLKSARKHGVFIKALFYLILVKLIKWVCMIISKINLEGVDKGSNARALTLKSEKGKIEFPTKIPNISELREARLQGLLNKLPTIVYEYVKFLNLDKIKKLSKENGKMRDYVSSTLKEVKVIEDYNVTKFFPKIPLNVRLSFDDLITLIDFQIFSHIDLLCVPDSTTTAREYLNNISKVISYLDEKGIKIEVMPYLNTAHRIGVFESKLKGLVDQGFKAIGLDIRGALGIYPQLRFTSGFLRDKDVWIHASNVSQRYPRSNLSFTHLLPYFGIDSFSKTIFLPPREKRISILPDKVKRFDRQTLGMLDKENHKNKHGENLSCDCPICEKTDLNGFYSGSGRQILGRSKVHEIFSSFKEFTVARNKIMEHEFMDYMRSKEFARPVIDDLTRRLNHWI